MNYWLAFKRVIRSPGFIFLVILSPLAVFLTSFLGVSGERPPGGVCNLGAGPESQRMVQFLTENGYITVEDVTTGEDMVKKGELDCLLVLPVEITECIESGKLNEAVRFVVSPSSFTPELYRNLAAAALFREYAPYITSSWLKDSGIEQEAVFKHYWELLNGGYAFGFDVITDDGAPAMADIRGESVLKIVVSVLLMAVLFLAAGDVINGSFEKMSRNLGLIKALKEVLVPEMAVRAVISAVAVSASLYAAYSCGGGAFCLNLIPCVFTGCILYSAAGIFLSLLLPNKQTMYMLLPVLLVGSLAVCPVFTDLALTIPAVRVIRLFMPAYWFWLMGERPLLWLMISAAVFALALAAVLFRG